MNTGSDGGAGNWTLAEFCTAQHVEALIRCEAEMLRMQDFFRGDLRWCGQFSHLRELCDGLSQCARPSPFAVQEVVGLANDLLEQMNEAALSSAAWMRQIEPLAEAPEARRHGLERTD